jgi:hypothetical protein
MSEETRVKTIEESIFDMESIRGWDEQGVGHLTFYDAKLIIDIAPFKAGDVIDCITINGDDSAITLQKDYVKPDSGLAYYKTEMQYRISYAIGELICGKENKSLDSGSRATAQQ